MKTRIVAAAFAMAAAIVAGPAAAQLEVEDPSVLTAIETQSAMQLEELERANETLVAMEGTLTAMEGTEWLEYAELVAEVAFSTTEVGLSATEVDYSRMEREETTGPRGMAALARTPESYIPLNWEETLALMEKSGGELGGLAEQIRKSVSKLDESYFAGVDPALKAELDREMQGAAAGVAMNATVYDASETRKERLDELADAIEEAEDPKAIWDLQARVSIENGMLLNELIRLQSMNAMVANQRRINAQQTTQESFSLTSVKY